MLKIPTGIYEHKPRSEEIKRKISEGMKKYTKTEAHRRNLSISHMGVKRIDLSGGNHWKWKGDDVEYSALHHWVNRSKQKIGICEICNEYKKTEWANIDHKYSRNLDDYIEVCRYCHRSLDRERMKESEKKVY